MLSLKPYLIRAVYDVVVPRHSVQDGRIVLNLRPQAVHKLALGNERIEFNARFGGSPMQVRIPIAAVLAIYARENGQGMVFDGTGEDEPSPPAPAADDAGESKPSRQRPVLKVVK
jgi:stringent starvation protein B